MSRSVLAVFAPLSPHRGERGPHPGPCPASTISAPFMTTPEPVQRSEYMHWAKTRQAARYNLAVSGVPGLSLRDLPGALDDVELNGASTYGWPPLQQALSRHLQVDPDRIVHAAGTSMLIRPFLS